MQNLNCSLCYSFVNYEYKCTTFFIYPIKKSKKIGVIILSQKNLPILENQPLFIVEIFYICTLKPQININPEIY